MYWYEGKLIDSDSIELKISEPGLIYGATVFTTLRVYHHSLDHPLTQWQHHCDRLKHSVTSLQWNLPDWVRLRQGADCLSSHYPVLRITLFPDGREWILERCLPEDLAIFQREGIKGWVAESPLYCRSLAIHKTGNYLGAWLALQQAKQLGKQEAILIDAQLNWLETSTGNLWGWKQGIWHTPPIESGILPGIGRLQLLHWLKQQQIPVNETQWTPEFIESLAVIAYSNSVVEIVPFQQIQWRDRTFNFNPSHPVLQQLRDYYLIN